MVDVARGDAKSFSNITATTAAFTLVCAQYGIDVIATWSAGSVTLQKLAGDGTTYVTVSTYTANIYETQNLPAGTYRIGVTTATGVYVQINSVATI